MAWRWSSRSFQRPHPVAPRRRRARGKADQEGVDRRGRAVEKHVDIGVPRRPGVGEERPGFPLPAGGQLVAQPVESLAERCPPGLRPARAAAGVAAAVLAPAAHPVGAAPGGVLDDLHLMVRRMGLQVLPVVGQPGEAVLLDVVEGVGEGHLAVAVMVAVGLAVGRDVHQPVVLRGRGHRGHQPVGEALAAHQQPLERHRPRDRAVVDEDREPPSRGEPHLVGHRGIDPAAPDVPPLLFPFAAHPPHPPGLMGLENSEADARLRSADRASRDRPPSPAATSLPPCGRSGARNRRAPRGSGSACPAGWRAA